VVSQAAREAAALAGLVAVGLGVRLWVLRVNGELNSDEVLPGLMALHIAAGREAPVFFYGQHYFGAAEAYLIAGLFKLFGFHPWLAVVPSLAASLALIPITYALAEHLAGRPAGLLAALPVAVPPPLLAKLFVNPGGGFSLAFALHGAALLCYLRAFLCPQRAVRWGALFSLLSGGLCWIWQPALALYAALLAVLALRRPGVLRPDRLLRITAPVFAGLAPPLLYNLAHGWPTLRQLAAKYATPAGETDPAAGVGPPSVATFLALAFGGGNEAEGGANYLQAALVALAFPLALLLLVRPRTAPPFGRLPSAAPFDRLRGSLRAGRAGAPAALRAGTGGSEGAGRAGPAPAVAPAGWPSAPPAGPNGPEREDAFLSQVWHRRRWAALVLAVAAAVDALAAHHTVRHLVPVALVGYAFAGAALALLARYLRGGAWLAAAVGAAVVVAPNAWLDVHAGRIFRHFVAGVGEVQAAVRALEARGLSRGYSDYWSAYPVSYFAGERIVAAPSIATIWGGRFDRYPAYAHLVDAVAEPERLFVLLDGRCSPAPYVQPLEQAGATYRLEPVASWHLVWDVRAAPGAEAATLAAWRGVIASRPEC
jgi:hypothetical protein